MPRTGRTDAARPSRQFHDAAARCVEDIAALFREVVGALPAPAPRTASELQRATALDMKLCWKVFRVLKSGDPLGAARFVPGPANMRSLMDTMRAMGAGDDLLARLASASERFERVVLEHAGDRQTFDSMTSAFADPESESKETLRQRRASFQANSHIWGVQADAMVMTMIQRPDANDPRTLDEVGLRAEYGVRRLRTSPVPIYEQSLAVRDKDGREYSTGHRRSLSGDGAGVGLIPEFCSKPIPEVVVRQGPDGRSNAVVMHSALGMTAAVDLVVGFGLRGLTPRYPGVETHGWAIAHLTKPYRTVIIDMILEEGTLSRPPRPFGFMSTKNTMMVRPEELWTGSLLTDGEPVRHLGVGLRGLAAPEAPRYERLVSWAIEREGWDPSRFEAWRLRVEYPVPLSSVGLVYEMPPEPK